MDVYSRIRKRIKPSTHQKVAADLIMLTYLNMEKETYTKEEVRQLIEPLMKQIEFYNRENIQLKTYIRENWIPFGNKSGFLEKIKESEDNSDTLIFNLLNQKRNELNRKGKRICH